MEIRSLQIESGIICVPAFVAVYIPRSLIKVDKPNPYLKLGAVQLPQYPQKEKLLGDLWHKVMEVLRHDSSVIKGREPKPQHLWWNDLTSSYMYFRQRRMI